MPEARPTGRIAGLDRDQIEARVREVVRLRMEGRRQEAEAYFSPDIVVESLGPDALRPWTGRFVGIDELRRFRKELVTEFEAIDGEILDLAVDGQICMVRRLVRYRNRKSGDPLSLYVWEKYTFRGGLIIENVHLMDTVSLARLAGRLDALADWLSSS